MVSDVIALGRVGNPDDIGAAVPSTPFPAVGWANGTRIELSGGRDCDPTQRTR